MTKLFVAILAVAVLAGCQGRTLWNDDGKVEEATTDREVWDDKGQVEKSTSNREIWDSNGKMGGEGRKIWNDSEGNPVVQ